MLEEERTYEVDGGFTLPDLTGCLPPGGSLANLASVTAKGSRTKWLP